MTITDQILLKIKILLDSDFKHYVKRDIYFNRETKKIFSREFVRYNSEKVIKDKLQEKTIRKVGKFILMHMTEKRSWHSLRN